MKWVMALGLILSIPAGVLAVAQLDTLQDTGEAEAGALAIFFQSFTPLVLILVGVVGVLALASVFALLFRN